MNAEKQVLFLPGAGGSASFWRAVADRLPREWGAVHFSWPGLGDEPPDPAVQGMDALIDRVVARIDQPVDIVAQSMGGAVAVAAAIERPALVRRLVLACCSGGLDMSTFGAADWRPAYRQDYPRAAAWITDTSAARGLSFEKVEAPTLLLWGDADPISPVAVGRFLARRLPNSTLRILAGAGHDLALTHTEVVADLIRTHLADKGA